MLYRSIQYTVIKGLFYVLPAAQNESDQILFCFDASLRHADELEWDNIELFHFPHRCHTRETSSKHFLLCMMSLCHSSEWVLSVPEGCTDLTSSLEGVRMTTEGIFIMEEAGPTDTAVSFIFSLYCHSRNDLSLCF